MTRRRGLGTGLERISEGGCQSKPAACIYFNLWQEINIYTRKRWDASLRQASAAHQLQLQDHLAAINELEDENSAEKKKPEMLEHFSRLRSVSDVIIYRQAIERRAWYWNGLFPDS